MDQTRCDLCGDPLTADQLVSISGKTVCARCKPDLLMNLKSGIPAAPRISPERASEIKSRISRLNILSFVFALPGIALQAGAGAVASGPNALSEGSAVLLRIVGAPLIIAGLVCYARMKARSGWWGLLGLLSCLGLIILHYLPKNCHNCGKGASYSAKSCSSCDAPV